MIRGDLNVMRGCVEHNEATANRHTNNVHSTYPGFHVHLRACMAHPPQFKGEKRGSKQGGLVPVGMPPKLSLPSLSPFLPSFLFAEACANTTHNTLHGHGLSTSHFFARHLPKFSSVCFARTVFKLNKQAK